MPDWRTLGAAYYCAGSIKEALVALEKSKELGQGSDSFDWFLLAHPANNPCDCQTYVTGSDFCADRRRAAVCAWDGDALVVEGIDARGNGLSWLRFASDLFQPLGLKIVRDAVYACCRDHIAILCDFKPAWSMAIEYNIQTSDGSIVKGLLHNTIHYLGE